jgi:hypothetical protein
MECTYLRLGAFFSKTSGLIVRLAGDCESRCRSPTIVDENAGEGVDAFVAMSILFLGLFEFFVVVEGG